jgi:hypothetical protein
MIGDRKPAFLPGKTSIDALDYEIAQDMAAALGRLGRRLEHALRVLAEFDTAHCDSVDHRDAMPSQPAMREQRRALVADAGDALWHFVVQREACGLRDSRQVMRDYRVPAEVQYRMGALPPTAKRRGAQPS